MCCGKVTNRVMMGFRAAPMIAEVVVRFLLRDWSLFGRKL